MLVEIPVAVRAKLAKEPGYSSKYSLRHRKRLSIYKWIVSDDYTFELKGNKFGVVPRGFLSDGCSGPGFDRWGKKQWLVHDWLYCTGGYLFIADGMLQGEPVSRKEADNVFTGRFLLRYWAVRAAGWAFWNRKKSRRQIRPDLLPAIVEHYDTMYGKEITEELRQEMERNTGDPLEES